MDLQLHSRHYLVLGASSGFGLAVAKKLLQEGAVVTVVARRKEVLENEFGETNERVKIIALDLGAKGAIDSLSNTPGLENISGVFINGGGPPAASAMEAGMQQWDDAYNQVFRWKVELVNALLPGMIAQQYGRIVFLESISVKQPIENLVLSNAMRAAVVGFAKTLANEVGKYNVTVSVLAPGFHDTSAMDRIVARRQQDGNESKEQVLQQFASATAVKKLGDANELASLACWLFSPQSSFVTGQTISVDGGLMKGIFG